MESRSVCSPSVHWAMSLQPPVLGLPPHTHGQCQHPVSTLKGGDHVRMGAPVTRAGGSSWRLMCSTFK